MRIDTGELRNIENLKEMVKAKAEGFEEVPEYLNKAAKLKLKGEKSAMVSLTSGGRLSRWAASKRKKKRQKAKAERRANRHC